MNYKIVAMEDLRTHPQRVESLENIRERMVALKSQYESIKVQATDSTPVQGGACRVEDRLINNIVERERLKLNYRAVKPLVDIVERGLASLSEDERDILTALCEARHKDDRIADALANRFHISRATVYRIFGEARYKFTIHCYGILEL